jgi:hypothetical protein
MDHLMPGVGREQVVPGVGQIRCRLEPDLREEVARRRRGHDPFTGAGEPRASRETLDQLGVRLGADVRKREPPTPGDGSSLRHGRKPLARDDPIRRLDPIPHHEGVEVAPRSGFPACPAAVMADEEPALADRRVPAFQQRSQPWLSPGRVKPPALRV